MKINRFILVLLMVLILVIIIIIFQVGERTKTPRPVLKAYIKSNLHRLVMGGMVYMSDHDVKIVTYTNLTRDETYLDSLPLKCYLGEDYTSFEIADTDTSVEVVTQDGEIVSYAFPPFKFVDEAQDATEP